MLKASTTTGSKGTERLHRNIEKFSQACITFEHSNKQFFTKMRDLTAEK